MAGRRHETEALCPIIAIRTTGDKIQDRPLVDAGGKGLFVKEIEEALLAGEADIAVHSMKDMPAVQPPGLVIAAVLEREDPHDVFLGSDKQTVLASQAEREARHQFGPPAGAGAEGAARSRDRLLARQCRDPPRQARARRSGRHHAGARRADAGSASNRTERRFSRTGCRRCARARSESRSATNDQHAAKLVAPIDHRDTHVAIACERGFLATLDGSCRTPIAGLARVAGRALQFRGEVLTPDGRNVWTASRDIASAASGARDAADAAGRDAAREILERAGDKLPRF